MLASLGHNYRQEDRQIYLTSAWGKLSFGGASTDSRQFSIANNTLSFPGVGKGTLDTKHAMTSHNGLL